MHWRPSCGRPTRRSTWGFSPTSAAPPNMKRPSRRCGASYESGCAWRRPADSGRATCTPRGQLFKGEPPTGRFVVFTAESPLDLEIPGEPYTFGTLLRAQALGDVQALRAGGRAVLHIHLTDPAPGLLAVARLLQERFGR